MHRINLRQVLKIIVLLLIFSGIPLALTQLATLPVMVEITKIVQAHLVLFISLVFFGKTASIVYPPLPGSVLTLGAIPFIGWELAYLVDLAGSTSGATLSYFLGRMYGKRFLLWVMGEQLVNKITSIKVKDRNQIEATFILRIATGGILSDGLAWGASLIGLRPIPFVIGYFLSHVLTTAPIFYLLSISSQFQSWVVLIPLMGFAWFLVYKLKGKYFE